MHARRASERVTHMLDSTPLAPIVLETDNPQLSPPNLPPPHLLPLPANLQRDFGGPIRAPIIDDDHLPPIKRRANVAVRFLPGAGLVRQVGVHLAEHGGQARGLIVRGNNDGERDGRRRVGGGGGERRGKLRLGPGWVCGRDVLELGGERRGGIGGEGEEDAVELEASTQARGRESQRARPEPRLSRPFVPLTPSTTGPIREMMNQISSLLVGAPWAAMGPGEAIEREAGRSGPLENDGDAREKSGGAALLFFFSLMEWGEGVSRRNRKPHVRSREGQSCGPESGWVFGERRCDEMPARDPLSAGPRQHWPLSCLIRLMHIIKEGGGRREK